MKNRIQKFLLILTFILISFPNTVFAEIITHEAYVATEPDVYSFTGQYIGGQFGATIASGDFNNDGIDDLVVGAPFASTGLNEWNGQVSIVFGKTEPERPLFDLGNFPPDISFFGEHSGDQLGTSLTVGDYNNDGLDDLAIGAYNAYFDGKRPGKAYLIYGRRSWTRFSYNFASTPPDVLFAGHDDEDEFSLSLVTLDINNDHVDDLLIGAPSASTSNAPHSGAVYAYFGEAGGFHYKNHILTSRLPDVTFYGQAEGDRFGRAVSGGYITNGDKLDIVIGAYKADTETLYDAGKVYVYRGLTNFLSTVRTPTSTIDGTSKDGWFGFALDVEDMNIDGEEDIIAGSFPYSTNNSTGKVTVFYGGNRYSHKNSVYKDNDEGVYFTVDSPIGDAYLGADLLAEDFDLNNRPDLVVGAPGIGKPNSDSPGEVYMIFSDFNGHFSNYSIKGQTMDATVHGLNPDDWFGYSVHSLDFNNDGYLDLAVGSRYSDSNYSSNNGKVFLLFGDGLPFGEIKTVSDPGKRYITRAEFISLVLKRFEIYSKKADFIDNCYKFKDFCLFNFSAMSTYDDIVLDPEPILYPDVPLNHQYYYDIVTSTMLGLINGFINEKESPFYPDMTISRIQALKIILSANELVPNKYKFELIGDLGSQENLINQDSYFSDIDARISHMWWYPRYANTAFDYNIIPRAATFRPDDSITVDEAEDFIQNTLEYLKNIENEEVEP